ncbi:SPOR domain-containing protein [Ramlibacter tataouinensis]|uniref:SPOR domain-containing protein n=1 Tax=Ramlibacter tataouinensis TaxID=94132 RepID=UPI0022F3CBAD|nr:SPOR domain-containing protein [Ramlibacter tataouinensis]WBY00092.1 SPOR domain-containing protein [Ramlibacter tataouinensis]
MLRLAVLLLLLANGVYYAWSEGLLLPWGWGPLPQTEPYRLEQQIQPERIRVLPAEEAKRPEAATAAAAVRLGECLQAGPLPEPAAEPLRQAMAGWPASAWTLEPVTEPPRWIVYMGKYPSAAEVDRKKGELRQIGVAWEPLTNADLEPGLSLGGFATQQAADQHRDKLLGRGVRTARVLQERPETRGHHLKLVAIDETLRARLEELRPLLNGKALRPCR